MTFWSEAKHGGTNTKRSRLTTQVPSHVDEGSDQESGWHQHYRDPHQHYKSPMSSNLYSRFNPFQKLTTAKIDSTRNTTKLSL